MSELPPPPPGLPQLELVYETPPENGNAPLLVRLAGIFLLVSGSLDVLAAGYEGVILAIQQFLRRPMPMAAAAPPAAPPGMPMFMSMVTTIIPIVIIVLDLSLAGLKGMGASQLLRQRRRAWAWGLAAGIGGCVELWSCPCCFASMATGIFTIVVLCLPHVKGYLKTRAEA